MRPLHYSTTTSPLHGPGLQALTKLKAMPSGAPPLMSASPLSFCTGDR